MSGMGSAGRSAASLAKPAATHAVSPGPIVDARSADGSLAVTIGLWLALLVLVTAVYWPVLSYGFLAYDDPEFVAANPQVLSGLTWSGVVWSVTEGPRATANFQPVTFITYMLDVSLWGADPRALHRSNLLWHLLNVTLVWRTLQTLTGRTGPSLAVAAIFGLHPEHVETVTWISERKGLVSTTWGLLALWLFAWSARRQITQSAAEPSVGVTPRCGRLSWPQLLAVGAAFGLSLLSKQMLLLLPAVLLLLDEWPLERWNGRRDGWAELVRLAGEKLPLCLLAIVFVGVALMAQSSGQAVRSWDEFPWWVRLANAAEVAWLYPGRLIWPLELSVYYPHPGLQISPWRGVYCGIGLVAVSLGLRRLRSWEPALWLGWMWYLVLLLPVVGLVQLAYGRAADRYVYVPSIGLIWAAVWLMLRLLRGSHPLWSRAVLGSWLVFACLVTRFQLSHWQSLEALCLRAIAVTSNNDMAEQMLGQEYQAAGRLREAIPHFERAARYRQDASPPRHALGAIWFELENFGEAELWLQEALLRRPDDLNTQTLLAATYQKLGRAADGLPIIERVCTQSPELPEAQYIRGRLLLDAGQPAAAFDAFRVALKLVPGWREAKDAARRAAAAMPTDERTLESR